MHETFFIHKFEKEKKKHSMIYKKLAKTVKLCRFYQEELLIYYACASNTCAVPTEQKNIFASNY